MSTNLIKQPIKAQMFDSLFEQTPCACFICERTDDAKSAKNRFPIVALNSAMRNEFAELQYLPLDIDAHQLFLMLFSVAFDDYLFDDEKTIVLLYKHAIDCTVTKVLEIDNYIVFNVKQIHELPKSTLTDVEHLFIENANNVYWTIENGLVTFGSSSFSKMWGRSIADAPSGIEDMRQWLHVDDKNIAFAWLHDEQWGYGEEYFRIVMPGDAIKWIWNKVHYDARKKQFVAISTDVTRQKHIEEELIVARDKAQESDRLKTAFLANISHEIRTPMNGIIGFSNLLAEGDFTTTEERRNYANIIINSSEQLLNIIDDIIDIAKIESNQLRITNSKVLVNGIMAQLQAVFEVESKRRNKSSLVINLRKGLIDEQSMIMTDEFRLRQILMNLLNNALKFTATGYVDFGYDIAFENNCPYLHFFVNDTGIGIPAEKRSLIFNHFYQVEQPGRHKSNSGTGLGLAISQGLVRLLGGRIWMESNQPNGCSFNFTVPYILPGAVISPEIVSNPFANLRFEGKRFLVVEDDDINFEVISRLLGSTCVELEHAPSGQDALRKINDGVFDLILLDIRLPDINGYDICRYIRERNTVLPVIAQTANAFPEDRQRCLDVGFSDYIAKPLSRAGLLTAITKHLVN